MASSHSSTTSLSRRALARDRARTLRCAALLVAALGVAACAGRHKQEESPDGTSAADKHYDVAVGSFHNGMFEDAKLQLERALAVDPKHADSYYLRGVLLLHEGKTLIDAIEGEQCLADDAAEQQRTRARELHRRAGEAFTAAAEHFDDGAAGRGRAYNSLAVVDLHFAAPEKAITHARKALEQKFYSDRYSALANLGWAYYNAGDLVSATSELRQAVLLNPDYCVGRYRLAQVYLEAGLTEQAIEQAATVVENSRCPIQDAHRVLGAARLRAGLDDDAKIAFESCVAIAPRSCLAVECQRLLGSDPSNDAALADASAR
ncbi:MAG TPA: tetratricopeptide repeat protein [Nannocystaceae bacterium]|nr:tetratricopeptide repeat protein [Nannocystaceae bacterium]